MASFPHCCCKEAGPRLFKATGQPSLLPAEPVLPQSTHDICCHPWAAVPILAHNSQIPGAAEHRRLLLPIRTADTGGVTPRGWFCPSLLDVPMALVCV